jgi:ribosome-binding factor A
MAILIDLQDPRVRDVTVTFGRSRAGHASAKVHVSVMGDEKKQQLAMRAAECRRLHAPPAVQRASPEADRDPLHPSSLDLTFVLDKGVKP